MEDYERRLLLFHGDGGVHSKTLLGDIQVHKDALITTWDS